MEVLSGLISMTFIFLGATVLMTCLLMAVAFLIWLIWGALDYLLGSLFDR